MKRKINLQFLIMLQYFRKVSEHFFNFLKNAVIVLIKIMHVQKFLGQNFWDNWRPLLIYYYYYYYYKKESDLIVLKSHKVLENVDKNLDTFFKLPMGKGFLYTIMRSQNNKFNHNRYTVCVQLIKQSVLHRKCCNKGQVSY